MNTGWVAATVRAKAMARRRVGAGLARRIATAPTLESGLALLAGTAFDAVSAPGTSLDQAEHRIRAEQLWELRVLAGWMPAAGTPLARSLAARFERANIERHRDRLAGRPASPGYELGTLATSWPRLAATTSLEDLHRELTASAWGDPGELTPTALHDALVVGWLRMVAATSSRMSAVGRWVAAGAALVVARRVVTLGQEPPASLVRAATPLIGARWASARSISDLRPSLPPSARSTLADVDEPAGLWRAEARLRGYMESDGFRMLRSPRSGPEPVVGALAVLAVDGWRVRAALADAAAGGGPSEVFDVVA
ncbi:MAG TPA: hypothetical protein VF082_05285 [Jiangellaceae bacterium]